MFLLLLFFFLLIIALGSGKYLFLFLHENIIKLWVFIRSASKIKHQNMFSLTNKKYQNFLVEKSALSGAIIIFPAAQNGRTNQPIS